MRRIGHKSLIRLNLGRLAWLVGLTALLTAQIPAQGAAPGGGAKDQAKALRVVIKPVEPFVLGNMEAPAGYSIDLWRRVASEAGFAFDFVPVKTTREMLAALDEGKADVAVGALSITADREARYDFSHSFYGSGLQILVIAGRKGIGLAAFAGLLDPEVLRVVGVLLIALLVNSHVLWLMERKRNPDEFPDSYIAGVWESAWWSVCTLITGGCENKSPAGVLGRLVAIFWMLAGVGLFSYITATVASTMTVNTLSSDIHSLSDLRGKAVGTVDGATAQEFLKAEGIAAKAYTDVGAACDALTREEVRAVVYDAPMLRYYLNKTSNRRLQFVGTLFDKQEYGFALQPGSDFREPINRAILSLEESGVVGELDKKWFGNAP